MLVHHFDRYTSAYSGSTEADANPEEPGKFLLPAFATFDVPPQPEPGTWPFWRTFAKGWNLENVPTPEPAPAP